MGYGKCNLQYIPCRSRECMTIYGEQPRPPADEVEAERHGNDPKMASADMERAMQRRDKDHSTIVSIPTQLSIQLPCHVFYSY